MRARLTSIEVRATLAVIGFILMGVSQTLAASCNAVNEVGDSCSIDCAAGQSAECQNGTGASAPTCACRGDTSQSFKIMDLPVSVMSLATTDAATSDDVLQVDALGVVNQKLAGLRDYHLSRACSEVIVKRICDNLDPCVLDVSPEPKIAGSIQPLAFCHRPPRMCYNEKETRCQDVNGKLSIGGDLKPEGSVNAVVSEPDWGAIPTHGLALKETYRNCGVVPQSFTFTHTERTRIGQRATKTKVVTTSQQISAEVSYSSSPGLGGKLGVQFKRDVAITNANEDNFEREETFNYGLPINVPPMTVQVVTHTWLRRVVPIPYRAVVRLDAPVAANLEGVKNVSDVVPNAEDRTFVVEGVIHDALALEGQTRLDSRSLKPEECVAPELTVTSEGFIE